MVYIVWNRHANRDASLSFRRQISHPDRVLPSLLLWTATLAIDDEGRGIEHLDDLSTVMGSLAGGVSVDEPTTALLRSAREATLELDLKTLQGLLPDGPSDGKRWIRLSGTPTSEAYVVQRVETLAPAEELGLGALQAELAMVGSGHRWTLTPRGALGTAEIGPGDAARLAEQVLVGLEQAGSAGSVLDELRRTAPALTASLDRVLTIRSCAELAGTVLAVDVDAEIDAGAVSAAGYPALGAWLDGLGSLLDLRVRITDPQGRPYVTGGWRSRDGHLTARWASSAGRLVPLSEPGPAVSLTSPALDFEVAVDVEVRDQGFLVAVTDLRIPMTWRSDGRTAHGSAAMTRLPAVGITGTNEVSTFIASLADSALGLRSAAESVFVALVDGESGARGSWIDGTGIAAEGHATLVDNGLIRYGARVAGRHLVPTDATVADASRLASDLLRALDSDYRAARPRLADSAYLRAPR